MTDQREVSLADIADDASAILRRIVRGRRLFVLPLTLTLAVGLIFAFGVTREYSAATKLVPYGATGSVAGLSGLAGLAGLRLPAGAGLERVISTDLYPEVAKTLDFRLSVAEAPLLFSSTPERMSAVEFFSEKYRKSVVEIIVQYTIGLPGLVLGALGRESSPAGNYSVPPSAAGLRQLERDYRKLIEAIGDRVSVSFDKKTGVIAISATMPDPVAAADLVRVSSEQLMSAVVGFEVRKAEEQLLFLESRLAEAQSRYEEAQRRVAAFADRNRVLVSAVAQLERSKLEREAEMAFELYQQLGREREQAKIRRSQDTPVFSVLETVTVPNRASKPRRMAVLALSLFVGIVLGSIRALRVRQAAA